MTNSNPEPITIRYDADNSGNPRQFVSFTLSPHGSDEINLKFFTSKGADEFKLALELVSAIKQVNAANKLEVEHHPEGDIERVRANTLRHAKECRRRLAEAIVDFLEPALHPDGDCE